MKYKDATGAVKTLPTTKFSSFRPYFLFTYPD